MKRAEHRIRRGFTLVELLVVITIIVVLASVSFIVSRKMLDHSKAVRSIENMRQIGVLVVSSATDNNGRLLALREFNGTDPEQPINWHWNQEVASMQFPDAAKRTISEDADWWWRQEPLALNPQIGKNGFQTYYSGYAMNLFISENDYARNNARDWEMILRHQTPLAALQQPERTPLIVPHWNWHTGDLLSGTKLNNAKKSRPFLNDGKMNVVFVDGHAEMIRFANTKGEPLAVSEYAERGLDKMPRY